MNYSAARHATVQDLSVGTGNLEVSAEGDVVQNGTIEVSRGDVTVDANGDLSMSAGALTQITDLGNVDYKAAGELLIDQVRTADGNVSLTAEQGDIQVHGTAAQNVTAKQLTANAAGNIGTQEALRSDVDTLVAKADSGSIVIDEANAITLDSVNAVNGSVVLSAGDIAINELQGDSIELVSSGKVETNRGGLVSGASLNVEAETGVNLHTAVNSATVAVNGSGDLKLVEDDGITLTRLTTADGDIAVTAAGNIGVNSVDAGSRNVSLTSTGGAIVTEQPSLLRRLFARVAQVTGISGDRVELTATNGLGNGEQGALQLSANTINAVTTSGDVALTQSQGVTLEQVSTGNGDVQVAVLDGDAIVGEVSGSGSVALSADNGQLLDDGDSSTRVQANALQLSASNGIGANAALQTTANTLDAQVSGSGNIAIEEADGLNRLTINSASGDVAVRTATGNLGVDVINASGHNVALQASTGAILDANNNGVSNVNAQRIDLVARNGVGQTGNAFDVNVQSLASDGGNGGVRLNSTSTGTLELSAASGDALKAAKGDIVLTSAGDLNVNGGVTNSGAGNILLTGVNVNQNANVTTSGSGNVSVNATKKVVMAANSTTRTDTGTVSYQGGESISVASIQTSNDVAGGKVVFVAPQVLDNMPGVANVKAWEVSLTANNGNSALIKELMGNLNDSAHVSLDSRVVGGSLAESRRFMEALLQPVRVQRSYPEKMFDAGLLSNAQISPNPGFVEGEDGVMTFNK